MSRRSSQPKEEVMPTVTRQQIKQVENRMRARVAGLGRISGPISLPYPSSSPPISGTSTNGSISFGDFWNFINGTLGQLKIEATQFAEGMNRLFYGMEPGCTNPVPNIPVVPNNPTPKFCSTSVAGMIERCRTTEATMGLNSITTQFQQRMANSSDPAAPYIQRWWNEYGQNNVSVLTSTIANARGTCGITGEIPKLCTAPQVWSAIQFKCVYPSEGGTSGGTTTMMMIAVLGLAAVMMMRR